MMEDLQLKFQKTIGDNSSVWVGQEMLNALSFFTGEGGLHHDFTTLRPSKD